MEWTHEWMVVNSGLGHTIGVSSNHRHEQIGVNRDEMRNNNVGLGSRSGVRATPRGHTDHSARRVTPQRTREGGKEGSFGDAHLEME